MERRTKENVAFVIGVVAGMIAGGLVILGFYLWPGDQSDWRVTAATALAGLVVGFGACGTAMNRLLRPKRHRY